MADYLISYVQAMELATWYRRGDRPALPARLPDPKADVTVESGRWRWRVDGFPSLSPNKTHQKPNR